VTEVSVRRLRVTGGELAYVETGSTEAPPVVLLSGGFTSSFFWRSLVQLFSPFLRVLVPDPPGSDWSYAEPDAEGWPARHARAVRELLDHLGIDRFALGGHGPGGAIAQVLALDGGVEALLLMDTVASGAPPAPVIRSLRDALAAGGPVDPEAWARALLEAGTVRPERRSANVVEAYRRPFAGGDGRERLTRVVASYDASDVAGLEPRLAALDFPALVLWGEEDAFVPPSVAERVGEVLPRAAVALLPGCGHLLLEDAAETVAPLVFGWLRSRYLKLEHRHEGGPVTVSLGRRPPGEEGP
jgi:pimeloyl-ACP methyl ester carboxylesterase